MSEITRRAFNSGVVAGIASAALTQTLRAGDESAGAPTSQPERPVPDRALLSAVPRVGFYNGKGNPEDHPLPSVMRACMEYMNDAAGLEEFNSARGSWQWSACALIHGVTGSGFHFALGDHGDSPYHGAHFMTPYERAFAAVGYEFSPLLRGEFASTIIYDGPRSDDGEEFRRRIVASIDSGLPVIVLGVIGPAEPSLACGYEDGGRTLVGWSHFVDEARGDERVSLDAEGRFRKRDWFADTLGIITIAGPRPDRPALPDVYRDGLRSALSTLCRTRSDGGGPLGIRAYQSWVRQLMEPVAPDVAQSAGRLGAPHERHNMNVGEQAERRAYASTFLSHAADHLPAAEEPLQRASRCYEAIHDVMWRIWQTVGTWNRTDDDALLRFGQQPYRRELASIIRRAQAWDLKAIELIREALVALGASADELQTPPALEPIAGLRDLGVDRAYPQSLDAPRWEGGNNGLRDLGSFQASGQSPADFAAAVALATTTTPSPIPPPQGKVDDVSSWAAAAGWRLRIDTAEASEAPHSLPWVQRMTDVVVSILHGLPVVTTWEGRAAVVLGYPHLAQQALYLREAGAGPGAEPTRVQYGDAKLGPTWIFLDARV